MAAIGAGVLAVDLSRRRHFNLSSQRRRSFEMSAVPNPKTVKCVYGWKCKRENGRLRLKDYCEQANDMIRSDGGSGVVSASAPPRWFSPLECRSCSSKSPLLLYLPGIDGTGLGLILNHQKLGEIFDVWCLHIPVMDRTPFKELVELVEKTVRSENYRSKNRPIYLVGESIGACIALSVAARNPNLDIVLILANPATSFRKSQLQQILPLLQFMPEQLNIFLHSVLSLITGTSLKRVTSILENRLPTHQTVGELSEGFSALSSYLYVMSDVLPRETLIWKMQMLNSASSYTNSRLHAVKAQTLVLSSKKDLLLSSPEECERIYRILPNSEIRILNSGHTLFLEDDVDLVTILKGAGFYRRSKCVDCASDFIPPTPYEFQKIYESTRWIDAASSPVMLSTLENGKIVRGLSGIPSKGPVVYVGYHMLLGCELNSLVTCFLIKRDILLRGLTHRMLFANSRKNRNLDISAFDFFRTMGAVPVSPSNFYRLLASNSHILLYPGGSREALHRKGEEYKLCWPEQSEFVRMAASFGAKIVPFGTVGEDDIAQVILDYTDLMKIPYIRDEIEKTSAEVLKYSDVDAEVANQESVLPIILPKVPGRFYFLFGKPIETEGRKQELRSSRDKAKEVYIQVKSEVEKCISFLKEKRERDPYRSVISRLIFQAEHGSDSQMPTFEL